MKKRKLKYKNIAIAIFIVIAVIFGVSLLIKKDEKLINLEGKSLSEIKEYASKLNLTLEMVEEYSSDKEKGQIINQSIKENTSIKKGDKLIVIISLGKIGKEYYDKYQVDESGNVPIMMYHGIHDLKDEDTAYIGGNIDKDGYQRTTESFQKDLDFYYKNNYRMIKLKDYINGIIDVELGKSPLVLTFDDGLKNNIKVTGLDENGEIIIDPNSAVGIMEEFKKKYPEFNITATFFINGGLFEQPEYNEKILKWLIKNNYDIGNHSYGHADFTNVSKAKVEEEIGKMYYLLEKHIQDKYVNIVALPFGSPYSFEHENFNSILNSRYEDKSYKTNSTLRVGWESEVSPFHESFNPLFLKRIRAYDNQGVEFDIEHNFKLLEKNRYISDGDKRTIVVPEGKQNKISESIKLELIKY